MSNGIEFLTKETLFYSWNTEDGWKVVVFIGNEKVTLPRTVYLITINKNGLTQFPSRYDGKVCYDHPEKVMKDAKAAVEKAYRFMDAQGLEVGKKPLVVVRSLSHTSRGGYGLQWVGEGLAPIEVKAEWFSNQNPALRRAKEINQAGIYG